MPYARPFIRTTMEWVLPGNELAQSSTSWDADDTIPFGEPLADAFQARLDAFWEDIKENWSAYTNYVGSHIAVVLEDGTIGARIDRPVTPVPGTKGGNPLPNEVALVMSLRTALAGRRTRGRMYLPPPSVLEITVDGAFGGTIRGNVSASAVTLLQPLTESGVVYTPVVASATGILMTPLTAVAVGSTPDAQRRRRDKQVESYTVEPL